MLYDEKENPEKIQQNLYELSFQIREPESSFELKSTSATNIIFNFQQPSLQNVTQQPPRFFQSP